MGLAVLLAWGCTVTPSPTDEADLASSLDEHATPRQKLDEYLASATCASRLVADGFASAMTSAEYADYFLSLASVVRGRSSTDARVASLVEQSFAFGRALDVVTGPRTGGVRSTGTRCGPKTAPYDCWFFHSRSG